MKKKIKPILLLAAVVLGVTGAVTSAALIPDCKSEKQYYKDVQGNYYPAGTEGVDYMCGQGAGNCTFTYNTRTNSYLACKRGKILFI